MKRWIAVMVTVIGLASASQASAQSAAPASGAVVVTVIPAGATFFTQSKSAKEPSFGNYDLGASVEVHVSRLVSIEGEVIGALGVTQDLQFASSTSNLKTPNLVSYSGNLVVSAANHSSVVPYVTGGVGGLTLLNNSAIGIADNQTFLTGNAGGGVKWFNSTGSWGLRGDYRFIAVRSDTAAPAFFGRETRYGHRVYVGLLINLSR